MPPLSGLSSQSDHNFTIRASPNTVLLRVSETPWFNRERSTKYILPGLLDSMGLFRFTQESSNGWSKSRGTG